MIDWFPGPDEGRDVDPEVAARSLERWRTLISLRRLARAVEAKDEYTKGHSERVAELASALARRLGWTPADAGRLHQASLVHDVGKISIPDAILLREGPLTPEERSLMRSHPAFGAKILVNALDHDQVDWVLHHHERWDGGGYPDGLVSEEIPDGARILCLADAWDAILTRPLAGRIRGPEEALAECRSQGGIQFAPECIAALQEHLASGGAALAPTGSAGLRTASGF